MNKTTKGGAVKLPIDDELRTALDAARRHLRTTRTGFVRAVLLKALKAEGRLTEGVR